MPHITFIAGLPGSGKTTEIVKYEKNGVVIFDDFMIDPFMKCRRFPYAQSFVEIVVNLRDGKDCVLSDVRLCEQEFRQEVMTILRDLVPKLTMNWFCFKNSPERCIKNVKFRAATSNRKWKREIKKIKKISKIYKYPGGATVVPVICPE